MRFHPYGSRIYLCEDGGDCFYCIGKERCHNYRVVTNVIKAENVVIGKVKNIE